MTVDFMLASLARFPLVIQPLVDSLDDATWRYRPDPNKWSILEILCHLRDEETEDFYRRLRSTLDDPSQAWPPIDPPQAAIERNYRADDPHEVLASFLTARANSLDWLNSLKHPDWELTYRHPELGPISAGQLLASWVGHDLLHLRQITKRLFESTQKVSGNSLNYAGSW